MKLLTSIISIIMLLLPLQSWAEWSGEVSILSDYRYNGVSNTNRGPAIQGEISYEHATGFYAGTWASNVDFGAGDPTDIEWDFYGGYFTALNSQLDLDVGVSYYSYWGGSGADAGNYFEAYVGLYIQTNTTLYVYYAPDYFGVDVDHYIVKLAHEIPLGDYTINVAAAHNQSADSSKYTWGETSADYQYIEVSGSRDWSGFTLKASAMATTIDDGSSKANAKPALVVGVSRAF